MATISYTALQSGLMGYHGSKRTNTTTTVEGLGHGVVTQRVSPGTSTWRRTGRFSELLLPTFASVVLLFFMLYGRRARDPVTTWVTEHQATAQLLVQVVSSVLGVIQTGAICELINVFVRRRLRTDAMRLNTLHF